MTSNAFHISYTIRQCELGNVNSTFHGVIFEVCNMQYRKENLHIQSQKPRALFVTRDQTNSCQTAFDYPKSQKDWPLLQVVPVNSKFHLIQSFAQTSVNFPIFSILNWTFNLNTFNSKFHVIQTFQGNLNSK